MESLVRLLVLTGALGLCVAEVRNVYSEAHYLGATTFLSYVDKAGLAQRLKDPSERLTVFAPTNVAFSQLDPSLVEKLNSNASFLERVLGFHVSKGLWDTQHRNNLLLPTIAGCKARVNVYNNPAVTTISGSAVLLDNNNASNGKVVILRRVMYPSPEGTALNFVNGNNFNMLLLAIIKADIASLFNEGNMTVLAPTNQAFQSLPPGVFSDLLDNITLLTRVLQMHVVKQVVYSAYVVAKGGIVLRTVSGDYLDVTVSKSSTMQIHSATVISPDQNVDNGVVHVIDKVLLPPVFFSQLRTPEFRVV